MFFLFGKNMFGDVAGSEIFSIGKICNFLITKDCAAFGGYIIFQQTDRVEPLRSIIFASCQLEPLLRVEHRNSFQLDDTVSEQLRMSALLFGMFLKFTLYIGTHGTFHY